jgi:hypothetical protein
MKVKMPMTRLIKGQKQLSRAGFVNQSSGDLSPDKPVDPFRVPGPGLHG